jgi:hypothetical protein
MIHPATPYSDLNAVLSELITAVRDALGGNFLGARLQGSFAVLNYCRMLHDLHTGRVGSKRAGAEWVKGNLDPAWAGLIDRAWSGRPKPEITSRARADPDELRQTVAFVGYIVEASKSCPEGH